MNCFPFWLLSKAAVTGADLALSAALLSVILAKYPEVGLLDLSSFLKICQQS